MGPGLFKISIGDLGRGIVTAFFGAFITVLYEAFAQGIPTTWVTLKPILVNAVGVGVTAGIAYLAKNFITNSSGQMAKAEPKQLELPVKK